MNPSFTASTQYNDWEGTAAADDADSKDLQDYLRDQELMQEDEFLVSAALRVLENSIFVHAYVYSESGSSTSLKEKFAALEAIPVREIDLEISAEQFIKFFKRFVVSLTWKTLDVKNKEFRIVEG